MRTWKSAGLVAVLSAALCVSVKAQQQQNPPNMEDIMKAMGKMMAPGTNSAGLVDFHELKALLPASLEGMKRTNASGEKTGALGMSVAHAEGTYQAEDGGHIDITITDMSGTAGMMAMAHGWTTTEIDRESDTGFERTTMIGDHKAYEKYDTQNKNGEVQVIVGDRFIVEIQGNNVPMESMKESLKKIDFDKLAALKPAPASTPAPAK